MATLSPELHGLCDAAFQGVKDVFRENFTTRGDVGASVAVSVDGALLVDLWAGHSDRYRTKEWTRDTIVTTYSTSKGMVSLCAHILADRGQLDFDSPVVRYWPEFGQQGKGNVLVRHVFTHSAGLPAIREALPAEAIFDWKLMTGALAAEDLWWEPSTKMGYHSVTFGFLAGEIIRRVSGRSVGSFLREQVSVPLSADFHIGFGPELDDRVAETIPSEVDTIAGFLDRPDSLQAKVFHNPPAHNSNRELVNTKAWRRAEIPSVNGHGNARALACIYGAASGQESGADLLSVRAVNQSGQIALEGRDEVTGRPAKRCLGFTKVETSLGPSALAFGHGGQGGSVGFADPRFNLGFGYVPNQMIMGPDERGARLARSVYASLAAME